MATVSDLITFIQAAHAAQDTVMDKLNARGAVMLIAYPEQLKTTICQRALRPYPEAMVVSDMNVREFSDIREDLLINRYDTIAFLDYQKIWERDERTSASVEGVIRALTDEGWHGMLGGKAMKGAAAQAFMVLCMTPNMYHSKIDRWNKNGFARRMIQLQYVFKERRKLIEAIKRGESYQLGAIPSIVRPASPLRYTVTSNEADYIELALKEQKGLVPLQLLLRTYNTLKWHFDTQLNKPDYAMQMLMRIVPMLTPQGGELYVDEPASLAVVERPRRPRRRAAERESA